VIHDDKTTEIIIPTPAPSVSSSPKPTSSASSAANGNSERVVATSSQLILAKNHWLQSLQAELSEDWTLRVLAALTILVLSLLVL